MTFYFVQMSLLATEVSQTSLKIFLIRLKGFKNCDIDLEPQTKKNSPSGVQVTLHYVQHLLTHVFWSTS